MGFIDNMRQKGAGDGTSSDNPEAAAPPNGDGKKRAKRRKPEEMLASVVRESTVNAVIDLLKQNEPFVLPGANSWAALALPVDYIGGLSKKHQKDEAKGSLIELINHDHIQAITTRYLLDEEVLGIIPTPQTLERMEEYSLLTNTTYHWMVLSPSPDGQELLVNPVNGKEASFADVVAIANGSRSLADHLPHVWAWTQAIDTPSPPVNTPPAGTPPLPHTVPGGPAQRAGHDAPTVFGHGAPTAATRQPEADADDHFESNVAAEPLVFGEGVEEAFSAGTDLDAEPDLEDHGHDDLVAYDDEDDEDYDTEVDDEAGSEDWEQYAQHHRDREFTEEQVRASIARRFLSGDLELEIALDEFEATFDTRAPAVRLELGDRGTEKPTDWLGEQVSLLANQANSELAKLHRNHRRELRGLFVETMSLHVESVMRAVDEQREGSVYQSLMVAADTEYGELRSKAPEDVSAQRSEITRRYEEDADNRAETAAAQARQAFWDRARPEFERRIADVALEVERRNEERHTHRRQLVLEMRRKDAQTRMQLGTTRAFQLLSEREAIQRQAEMDLLSQWNAKLTRYIDDNRKQDIARAEALAVQLQLDTSVEKLKAEHARRSEELRAGHENQMLRLKADLNRLTSDLERSREQAEVRMREREGEWHHKAQINNQMYSDLVEKTRNMTDTMHQEYQGQLMALNRTNHASIEELNRANNVQRRANKILFVLMAVFALAAVGVGVIIGWWFGYNTFGASAMALPVWSD
ncbi:hypothetical protein [Nocardiopsis prasina]|uniref:hypothetical protein n=1 Tax=Nocardiopsis prasina TaxID=2015 RepID=UPI00037E1807|nr:hypothetical protein [Nocardiopsis prasina]